VHPDILIYYINIATAHTDCQSLKDIGLSVDLVLDYCRSNLNPKDIKDAQITLITLITLITQVIQIISRT